MVKVHISIVLLNAPPEPRFVHPDSIAPAASIILSFIFNENFAINIANNETIVLYVALNLEKFERLVWTGANKLVGNLTADIDDPIVLRMSVGSTGSMAAFNSVRDIDVDEAEKGTSEASIILLLIPLEIPLLYDDNNFPVDAIYKEWTLYKPQKLIRRKRNVFIMLQKRVFVVNQGQYGSISHVNDGLKLSELIVFSELFLEESKTVLRKWEEESLSLK